MDRCPGRRDFAALEHRPHLGENLLVGGVSARGVVGPDLTASSIRPKSSRPIPTAVTWVYGTVLLAQATGRALRVPLCESEGPAAANRVTVRRR